MTQEPCDLIERTGKPQSIQDDLGGSIVRDLPTKMLATIESEWNPLRSALKEILKAEGTVVEHDHWDWRVKRQSVKQGRHRLFAITRKDRVQGLMAILGSTRTAKLEPANELVYIDYVENAPWNIRQMGRLQRFAPIGELLIAEAIQLSMEMGFEGRIGLHSLKQAEAFYRKTLGMSDLGIDRSYLNLRYFEFDTITAKQWLEAIDQ